MFSMIYAVYGTSGVADRYCHLRSA